MQDRFMIDSAGIHGYHVGEQPDGRSIATALNRDIDMRDQRARKVIPEDFNEFDLILAMDHGHYDALQQNARGAKAKIELFLDYHPNHQGQDVPDPYYSSDSAFESVFNLIEEGSEALLEDLMKKDVA